MTQPEQAVELLPCPFCGLAPVTQTYGSGKAARTGVKCQDVDCGGSFRLALPGEDWAALWNRRIAAPPPPAAGRVTREEIARVIEAIWDDICDRKGFDLNDLDDEVQDDIRSAWSAAISLALTTEEGTP